MSMNGNVQPDPIDQEILSRMDKIIVTTQDMLDRIVRVESRLTRTMQHLGLTPHGDRVVDKKGH